MRTMKFVIHPVYGNRMGHTTLNVAIDDFENSHNALQLNIDKYTYQSGNTYKLWHDGTLTVGKHGAVNRSEVINFIKGRSPELIDKEGKVNIGEFDNSSEITIGSEL